MRINQLSNNISITYLSLRDTDLRRQRHIGIKRVMWWLHRVELERNSMENNGVGFVVRKDVPKKANEEDIAPVILV